MCVFEETCNLTGITGVEAGPINAKTFLFSRIHFHVLKEYNLETE